MTLDTTLQAFATVAGSTAQFTAPDGRVERLFATPTDDIRHLIVERAADEARRTGSTVELVTTGDRGDHRLAITRHGTIEIAGSSPREASPTDKSTHLGPSQQGEEVNTGVPGRGSTRKVHAPEPPTRTSFITPTGPRDGHAAGWRAVLSRLGFGPSRAEIERRDSEHAVSMQWAGCRTIAIANGKGGVGKTMTTAMLAAVFGRFGGGNVLAWDNNDTRGTLGWRTEQGLYDSTIKDLLPEAADLLSPHASVSDIARFVHHQSVDRYDVLRSNPELLAAHQRIATAEFDLLMQVAARYYRVVIFDSGNDESAERWLRMIDSSYQLVVPTLAVPESAKSGALLLDALRERDDRCRRLAENAVVIVSEAEPDARGSERMAEGFAGQVRAVERIPFDPALKSGALRLDSVRRGTRDAWVRAAAAAAQGL